MRCLALLALIAFALPGPAQQKWGSLSGKVTFEGDIPVPENLAALMMKNGDAKICLMAPADQKLVQTWVVDPKTRGVANVFVYFKGIKNSFPIHADDKVRKKPAVVDQPFCTFVPHVIAHYPSYFDGKEQVPTGEKLIVKNSAKIGHNVRGTPSPKYNEAFNILIPAGGEIERKLNPQPFPFPIECNLHGWMNAHVMVLDHPYFAITKADGSFTIPRVPAGLNVTIHAWHEAAGISAGNERQMMLKEGVNELDFTLKVKKKD